MRDSTGNKPTVAQILNHHQVTVHELAHTADVSPNAVCAIIAGIPVSEELAEQVLDGLSTLTGDTLTLNNVRVTTK